MKWYGAELSFCGIISVPSLVKSYKYLKTLSVGIHGPGSTDLKRLRFYF
jgi:hypothetical protein